MHHLDMYGKRLNMDYDDKMWPRAAWHAHLMGPKSRSPRQEHPLATRHSMLIPRFPEFWFCPFRHVPGEYSEYFRNKSIFLFCLGESTTALLVNGWCSGCVRAEPCPQLNREVFDPTCISVRKLAENSNGVVGY